MDERRPGTDGSVTTAEQHAVLSDAHALASSGSLIPDDRNYIGQRHVYDGQCKAAGLSNMHGLRHAYVQARYEALSSRSAPRSGLGHERIAIVATYIGR